MINLAVSAFALTSLDSVARVGRLSFQEFFLDSDTDEKNMSPFQKVVTNKYFATIITLVLAYLLTTVSYTHLDVYKRQVLYIMKANTISFTSIFPMHPCGEPCIGDMR